LLTSNFAVPITGPTSVCEGDSVLLEGPDFMYRYTWSTGSTFRDLYAYGGDAWLQVENVAGCVGLSDTVTVTVLPLPATPVVIANGSTVESSVTAASYQWYREGVALGGATDQTYEVTISGNYSVRVIDLNGCTALSAPVFVTSTGIAEQDRSALRMWPNPANDALTIDGLGAERPGTVEVIDARGARMACGWQWNSGRVQLDVAGLATGGYAVRVVRDGGADVLRFIKR
jgi:hypothetical protein